MTAYDLDVIEEWQNNFFGGDHRIGVPPDVWDRVEYLKSNGYNHFREILNITGRRGGKGHIGGIIGAYQNWKLIQLDDPQWYYGIERSKELYLFVVATNLQQAKAYQFADFANTVLNAKCFQPYLAVAKEYYIALRTPADMRRIAEMQKSKIPIERLIASLRNVAVTSNSKSSRGAACFQVIFDEFAHMLLGTAGPRTSDAVYNAITPALDQIGKDGIIYIPTSPYTKVGKCYELYESSIQRNDDGSPAFPNMLTIQLPSWGPYEDWDDPRATSGRHFRGAPQLLDDRMKALQRREPDVFKVERLAQWAEVIDGYLATEMVDRMFEPFYDHKIDGMRKLEQQDRGLLKWMYWGHADPSKAQKNFAIAFGHTEPIKDEETGEVWDHVMIDWMHVWKPGDYEDHQIPYDQIEKEIANMLEKFPTMKVFSYDQYGAFVTIPRMRIKAREKKLNVRIVEEKFTHQSNTKRAEVFKAALGLNWVHAYRDSLGPDGSSLLEMELKFLQEKNGKVVCQSVGPIQTKDLSDCVMVVAHQLLAEQLDRLRKREMLGESRIEIGAQGGYSALANSSGPMSARDRLNANGQSASQRDWGYRIRRS